MNNIIGHKKQINLLNSVLSNNRMQHAWIFSGPSGVGKLKIAICLSSILIDKSYDKNLLNFTNSNSINDTLLKIKNRVHPDFHLINKESPDMSNNSNLKNKKQTNIPIDIIREFITGGNTSDGINHESAINRMPILGKSKVFIVDEIDLLGIDSQNALLKSLEEPPKNTFFFLITNKKQNILRTVKSRCQSVEFGFLKQDEIKTWLSIFWKNRDVNYDDCLIDFGGGSPGKIDFLLKTNFFKIKNSIDFAFFSEEKNFCFNISNDVFSFIDLWFNKKLKINKNTSKESASKECLFLILDYIGYMCCGLLKKNGLYNNSSLYNKIELIYECEKQIKKNLNLKHVFFNFYSSWFSL